MLTTDLIQASNYIIGLNLDGRTSPSPILLFIIMLALECFLCAAFKFF